MAFLGIRLFTITQSEIILLELISGHRYIICIQGVLELSWGNSVHTQLYGVPMSPCD